MVSRRTGVASPVVWNFGGAKDPRPTMPLNSFATNQSYLAVAKLTANDDPGTVDYAVPLNRRPAWDTPWPRRLYRHAQWRS